jgi:hypothetical protein
MEELQDDENMRSNVENIAKNSKNSRARFYAEMSLEENLSREESSLRHLRDVLKADKKTRISKSSKVSAPRLPRTVHTRADRIQEFGMTESECRLQFDIWAGGLFFFPDPSELQNVTIEKRYAPARVMQKSDGIECGQSMISDLGNMDASFGPVVLNSRRGKPDSAELEINLPLDSDENSLSMSSGTWFRLWRPVFVIRYDYDWHSGYCAVMAAGGIRPTVCSLKRPYVYI